MEKAMQRLSSGLRVNSASDDAAGLAVAGKMEAQLKGINMAIRNNQDAVGLIQTAEAGLNEVRNMILRIRELAVQMANGIYEDTPDRDNAQLEVTALIDQLSLIAGIHVLTTLVFSTDHSTLLKFRRVTQPLRKLSSPSTT